jgi:hypothetical protein
MFSLHEWIALPQISPSLSWECYAEIALAEVTPCALLQLEIRLCFQAAPSSSVVASVQAAFVSSRREQLLEYTLNNTCTVYTVQVYSLLVGADMGLYSTVVVLTAVSECRIECRLLPGS